MCAPPVEGEDPVVTACSRDVRVALDAKASTGESPTWSEAEQALYWIDIEQPALHSLDPETGVDEYWGMPSEIGAFALCRSGDVIVAMRTGLAKINLDARRFAPLSLPPYNPLTHRFNDGKCDGLGRFWVGVMYSPLSGSALGEDATGPLASALTVVSPNTGVAASSTGAVIANGLAWSPDRRTMYFSDSDARTIWAFDFDLDTATLSSRRVLAQFSATEGAPDGAAVDLEGFYWCALYGGARVIRLSPRGKLVDEIRLPVSQPTMCAFGGADYSTLYITSAAHGVSTAAEPLAGAVFACRPGATGGAPALYGDV
jgi:sugar lactone lactonase YvrE